MQLLCLYYKRLQAILLIFICAFIVSCAHLGDSYLQVNQQLTSPYTQPASRYLATAQNETGDARHAAYLMAAGRLIYDGQWQKGKIILLRLKHLPPILTDEKWILLAKIDLIRDKPYQTIVHLANVKDLHALSLYHQVQYHEMLAESYQQTGQASQAVSERIQLHDLLPDQASRANNLRALWLSLTTLPLSELHSLAIEAPSGSVHKGWMKLALISRQEHTHPGDMMAAIKNWQIKYPQHPGNAIISTHQQAQLFAKPGKIALLLPLSGPLAGPGSAVNDGFMAALQRDGKHAEVQLYDTNSAPANVLYQQAIEDGADYVLGPLTKDNVARVAALNHPVPTVLLNDASSQGHAYSFGLSPSNEAKQVAVKARNNGYTRAFIIAPDDAWGSLVVQAFTSSWHANGGRIIDILRFSPKEKLNTTIKDKLHITASETRKKRLSNILGQNVEATPRRRQDFDMIFLVATPSKARQIMPLLRYYYAGDVPIYAISTVYSGSPNSMKDRDLNGIIFCDMPWVFEHNGQNKHWPEQFNSYNRLYALGLDGYALSTQLNQLLIFPAMGVKDKTGALYLNNNNYIGRILTWGQFRDGSPQRLHDNIS